MIRMIPLRPAITATTMSLLSPDMPMPSAQRLCLILRRLRWTQGQIAQHVQTTQATISRIASGRHKDCGHLVYTRLLNLVLSLDGFKEVDDRDVGFVGEVVHDRAA
jgi:hypothetical protein